MYVHLLCKNHRCEFDAVCSAALDIWPSLLYAAIYLSSESRIHCAVMVRRFNVRMRSRKQQPQPISIQYRRTALRVRRRPSFAVPSLHLRPGTTAYATAPAPPPPPPRKSHNSSLITPIPVSKRKVVRRHHKVVQRRHRAVQIRLWNVVPNPLLPHHVPRYVPMFWVLTVMYSYKACVVCESS